jgi:hypothetical protein
LDGALSRHSGAGFQGERVEKVQKNNNFIVYAIKNNSYVYSQFHGINGPDFVFLETEPGLNRPDELGFKFFIFYRMKRFFGVLFLVLAGIEGSLAQGYQQIMGQVVDKSTGKPVEFAYVSIFGKAWGTLANAEGRFLLKYPKIDAQKDLIISAAGFQNSVLPLRNLKPVDSSAVNLERIVRAEIPSAFRNRTDARLLVFSALKSIPNNFPATPTVLTGFYRETLSTDTACWNSREAILKVEKLAKLQTELPEKVKLVKGRQRVRNPLPKVLEGYAFPNGAAIVTRSMNLGSPDYFEGDNLNDYEFRLDSVLNGCDNRPAYRLTFSPVADRRVRAARKGEILIDTASRAIVRISYDLRPKPLVKC